MRTEHQANAALAQAAQRIDWEGAHMDAWMKPAPVRPQRATHHATDYVLLVLLVSVVGALSLGVL